MSATRRSFQATFVRPRPGPSSGKSGCWHETSWVTARHTVASFARSETRKTAFVVMPIGLPFGDHRRTEPAVRRRREWLHRAIAPRVTEAADPVPRRQRATYSTNTIRCAVLAAAQAAL